MILEPKVMLPLAAKGVLLIQLMLGMKVYLFHGEVVTTARCSVKLCSPLLINCPWCSPPCLCPYLSPGWQHHSSVDNYLLLYFHPIDHVPLDRNLHPAFFIRVHPSHQFVVLMLLNYVLVVPHPLCPVVIWDIPQV